MLPSSLPTKFLSLPLSLSHSVSLEPFRFLVCGFCLPLFSLHFQSLFLLALLFMFHCGTKKSNYLPWLIPFFFGKYFFPSKSVYRFFLPNMTVEYFICCPQLKLLNSSHYLATSTQSPERNIAFSSDQNPCIYIYIYI